MNLYNYLNEKIWRSYISFDNWMYGLSLKYDDFLDLIFGESLFGWGSLYNGNPMTNVDKKSFTESLGEKITDVFDIVYNSKGMKWIKKGELEEAVAYA